ncbi:hypothetical protein FRC06_004732 [Ceratobasidium sp. 370]|nr:hypothetical protein FRC06_004732 [Ceratobasidium sp. 370]
MSELSLLGASGVTQPGLSLREIYGLNDMETLQYYKDNKAADGGVFACWNRQQTKGSLIASMALDILTAPASSVDAEQAFSGGRMAVNYRQHRTSISTFRAKMALGSWYGTPLMPNIDQAVEILTDGSGHTSEEPDLDP